MYNCVFDDADLTMRVKLIELLGVDNYGYYLMIKILKSNVIDLVKLAILPIYQNDIFLLKIRITNNTMLTLNGYRITSLENKNLKNEPIDKLVLKELLLKRYSKNTNNKDSYCYAEKIILTNPYSKERYIRKWS